MTTFAAAKVKEPQNYDKRENQTIRTIPRAGEAYRYLHAHGAGRRCDGFRAGSVSLCDS